jgi:hypothetical protein
MSLPSFVKYILPLTFLGTAVAPPHQIQAQENKSNQDITTFFCGTYQGKPATIAKHPVRGEVAMILWTSLDFFEVVGWPPQRLCREVSRRLQENHEEGTLNYMVEGRLNGYPVICASPDKPENEPQQCSDETMLWTLHPRKNDPQQIIQNIYDISIEKSSYPVLHNNPLVTSPDGTSRGIDIDNLLRIAPAVFAEDSAEDNCRLFEPCSQ